VIDPRALASDELRPGERLLWVGQSDPGRMFTKIDLFLVPFGIVWCGLVVTSWVRSFTGEGDQLFRVLGAVFALVGLYFVVGRFVVKRRRKQTEVYAVTDRRAFVTNGRSTRETDLSRRDRRQITWSQGRRFCTVDWEPQTTGLTSILRGGNQGRVYANTGLDGVFGPRTFAFYDVTDGDALVRVLDEVSVR
jgi:hypothetical protein